MPLPVVLVFYTELRWYDSEHVCTTYPMSTHPILQGKKLGRV
jgi:hypothetical protein